MADDRRLEELTVAESLLLLGSVPVGRVVFTHRALPAIRPVNHLLAADRIIFRASLGAAITAAAGDETTSSRSGRTWSPDSGWLPASYLPDRRYGDGAGCHLVTACSARRAFWRWRRDGSPWRGHRAAGTLTAG